MALTEAQIEQALNADLLGEEVVDVDTLFPMKEKLLDQARRAWDAWEEPRARRKEVRDVIAGLQWRNYKDPDTGETINEADAIRQQGRIPWVMNKTRPILRNLQGQFLQNRSDRVPFSTDSDDQDAVNMITEALAAVRRECQSRVLDADGVKEHLAAGYSIRKVDVQYVAKKDREEIVDNPVHPNAFFCNRDFGDRRMPGLRLIGELHDLTWEKVIETYALDEEGHYDPRRAEALREVFGAADYEDQYDRDLTSAMGFEEVDQISFRQSVDPWMYRVIEIWTLEQRMATFVYDPLTDAYGTLEEFGMTMEDVESANALRKVTGDLPMTLEEPRPESEWVSYHMTYEGRILRREWNPFWHQDQPYSVSLAGFFDGNPLSLLLDVIDPQTMLNRLYSQIDAMIGAAAKGLWMIPIESIPEEFKNNREAFADEVSKVGNMLFYQASKLTGNIKPEVITSLSIPVGLFQFFQAQTQFMEEISGVTGAAQGFDPKSGTPFSLYAQQIQQASTGSLEAFETYLEALHDHDVKVTQLIMQYWSEPRQLRAGNGRQLISYDPERVRTIHYDVGYGEVADTATYRMMFEQDLKELLNAQRITLPQYLAESSHPRARALLRLIEASNQLLDPNADPALAEQFMLAAQAGDMDAVATLNQAREWEPGLVQQTAAFAA